MAREFIGICALLLYDDGGVRNDLEVVELHGVKQRLGEHVQEGEGDNVNATAIREAFRNADAEADSAADGNENSKRSYPSG